MTNPTILAVSTAPMWRLTLDDAFAAISAVGADGVEVLVTGEPDTQQASTLERLAQRHDLPIIAIHAPMMMLTRQVFGSDPVVKIERTLELARGLGTQTIVCHPPYLWQVRYSLWILHELQDAVAGTGTMITMENMYPVHVGSRRLPFYRYGDVEAMQRFEHVTLDTSHLAVAEEDIVEAYRRLADRVVHVHLSDNRGRGRDSHAPPGEGVLPLADFVQALLPERLRSIALEINPGPAAEDRGRLEKILADALQLVRDNFPSSKADA